MDDETGRSDHDDSTATVSDRPARGAYAITDDAELLAGVELPLRFEAKRVIGRGGMGVVIAVLDRNLGREVAVKLLAIDKRDPVHQVRFRREAKAAAVLRHPNIVTVHDVDTVHDFIVMELVRGESLRTRIQRGALPVAEVRRIGLALLDALAAAHDARIIHRDVKPSNILIDERGTVKLVDFGIASFGDRDLTSSGVRIGTPAYMAPEQLRGRIADVRADVYAVGATLFEAATGKQLHGEDRSARDVRATVLAATSDPALATAIERAVAELPDDRFADARAFAAALSPSAPSARRRRWPWLAAAAVIASGTVVAMIALRDRAGARREAGAAQQVVGVLPFVDHTHDPANDFASSGLPDILSGELAKIPDLKVVGYSELYESLADPSAPEAAWRAAARAAGADVIVRGDVFAVPAGMRIVVVVESSSGAPIEQFERVTARDAVFATTRAVADDIARAAFGRTTVASGEALPFEIERELESGITAFEREEFTAADEHLRKVELAAPDLADALYYRALLNWWLSRDAITPTTRAIAAKLDPARHGVMVGLLMILENTDPMPAIRHFRALAAQFPDHRDTRYALFEALYHGGRPAEAMIEYHRIADHRPRFRLGLKHPLAYYIGHADRDGMQWASARLDDTFEERVLWDARLLVARRDYAGAIAVLRSHEADDPTLARSRELLGVYLLDGKYGLASDLATDWPKRDPLHSAAALFAFAIARGDRAETESWRAKAVSAAALAPPVEAAERGWLELAAIALPEGDTATLREIAKHLDANGTINVSLAHVLVAGALGDRAAVARARASVFPEVASIAQAYEAEWAKDRALAAARWRQAVDQAADGKFAIVEQLAVARNAGDPAAVLAACDEVIRPRRFSWAWASAAGTCLRWSAEAATARAPVDDARAVWRRLIELRASAPSDDELVRAARAALE